jgi:L-rhamnose-H+ transport protein
MISSNPFIGTGLHAIGGVSAASCYLPNTLIRKWSWGTFWLVQSLFAWIIMPVIVGWLTVPGFFTILAEAPSKPFWLAFLLGGAYGFGGMSFGKAINYIGYSLTYTLAIGISAVLGKSVKTQTNVILIVGLLILIISFSITSFGSYTGEQLISNGH